MEHDGKILQAVSVLYTGLTPSQIAIVNPKLESMGGKKVDKVENATHIVVDKRERVDSDSVRKVLKQVGADRERIVVIMTWINQQFKEGKSLPVDNYIVLLNSGDQQAGIDEEKGPPVKKVREEIQVPLCARYGEERQPLRYDPSIPLIPAEDCNWQPVNSGWVQRKHCHLKLHPGVNLGLTRMAAFDVDDTIISSKSGVLHSADEGDWKLRFNVVDKLRQLQNDGFYLAFLSNQGALSYENSKSDDERQMKIDRLHRKIDQVLDAIGLPIDYICALDKDSLYRKPGVGMWQFLMIKRCRGANLNDSFFVGDAAGRLETVSRKADFESSDFLMALNMGIKFYTPEAFFEGSRAERDYFLPRPTFDRTIKNLAILHSGNVAEFQSLVSNVIISAAPPSEGREIVLLVGPPASGKSTLARMFPVDKYRCVNNDTLGNIERSKNSAKQHLDDGFSVVVDNLNFKVETRNVWTKFAYEKKMPIRCIVINMHQEVSIAMAKMRYSSPLTDENDRRYIPEHVIKGHFREMQEIEKDEIFFKVDKVNWVFQEQVNTASDLLGQNILKAIYNSFSSFVNIQK